jgi:hypothetical protein
MLWVPEVALHNAWELRKQQRKLVAEPFLNRGRGSMDRLTVAQILNDFGAHGKARLRREQ